MSEVEIYYGLGSRYSYLAFTQIECLEAKHSCQFDLHPVSTFEVMELHGVSPFDGSLPSGQYEWDFRRKDAETWAAYYGVTYIDPKALPEDHRLMAKACQAAACQSAGCQDALRAYSHAIYDAVFVKSAFIDEDACVRIASAIGLDAQRFAEDIVSDAVDQRVTASAVRGNERGAFGLPTIFVGDQMFWGNDRLVLVDDLLSKIGGHS